MGKSAGIEAFAKPLGKESGEGAAEIVRFPLSIHVAAVPQLGHLFLEWQWQPPRGSVQLWWTRVSRWKDRAGQAVAILSPEERSRARAIKSDIVRSRFVIRRALLRVLLGACLGGDPSRIAVCYGRYGKPSLDSQGPWETIGFNVSHCDDLALFGFVRGCEIGVDMERIQAFPEMDAVIRRHASPVERKRFGHLPPESRKRLFFQWWTRKEAVVKAAGRGLSMNLEDIETALFTEGPRYLAEDRSASESIRCYWGHDVALVDGVASSVAVGPDRPWAGACRSANKARVVSVQK